jgi:hypothetical protein
MEDTAKFGQMQGHLKPGLVKIQSDSGSNQHSMGGQHLVSDSTSVDSSDVTANTLKQINLPKPVELFHLLEAGTNKFDYKPSKVFIEKNKVDISTVKTILFEPNSNHRAYLNWSLLLGLISISLILVTKTNYRKFMDQVVNAIINFQLAEKTLREKNILARRAYFMLNLNYILMFALFILLVLVSVEFHLPHKYYLDYMIIFSGLSILILIRLGIIYLNGFLFQMMPATLEYIHNVFLINKNLGIIFLPVLISSIYTPPQISKILLTAGFILLFMATLLKIVRGFQIIIKNRVLLFYSILYLCTLELLPLVLGSKLIIALR